MRASLAILLMAWSATAAGQQLGTLFHTPKERDLLERLRRGEKVEPTEIARPDPTLTGFVKRSDGKSTVFLDKQPFPVGDPKLNRQLESGLVERFDPAPPPLVPAPVPVPTARSGVSESSGKPETATRHSAPPPKRGDEE